MSLRRVLATILMLCSAEAMSRLGGNGLFEVRSSTKMSSTTLEPETLAQETSGIARMLRVNNCFAQATALAEVLRAHGYPADVVIGVHKSRDAKFEGHAWVELGTQKFMDLDNPYTEVFRIGPAEDGSR